MARRNAVKHPAAHAQSKADTARARAVGRASLHGPAFGEALAGLLKIKPEVLDTGEEPSEQDATMTDSSAFVEQLKASALAIQPSPAALILFGSTVRGELTSDSDVDVLAVRPPSVAFDDDPWTDAMIAWCDKAHQMTGRYVQMVDAAEDEMPELLSRPGPSVWQSIAAEGVVLAGRSLTELATFQ